MIDIEQIAREERKRIDWARVHIEADRREPLWFIPNPGKWLNIIRRPTNAR